MSERRILRPSRRRWALMLVGSVALTAGSVAVIRDGNAVGWAGVVLFGLGMPISALKLLPNTSYLLLTPEGFTTKTLARATTIRWQDVDEFRVVESDGGPMVAFDFSREFPHAEPARALVRGMLGHEGALEDTYGLDADELAALMNDWRRRHAPPPPEPEPLPEKPVEEVFSEPPGRG